MWTETGVWYDAEVLTMDVNTRQAQLWYPSDEAEDEALGEKEDINIEEAILDDEVSWPLDETKMRVTSEEARENAKRLKRERDKQREKKNIGGAAGETAGTREARDSAETRQRGEEVRGKFERGERGRRGNRSYRERGGERVESERNCRRHRESFV